MVCLAEAYVGMQFGCKQGGNAVVKFKLLTILSLLSDSHRYIAEHCSLIVLASDLMWAVFASNKTACSLA